MSKNSPLPSPDLSSLLSSLCSPPPLPLQAIDFRVEVIGAALVVRRWDGRKAVARPGAPRFYGSIKPGFPAAPAALWLSKPLSCVICGFTSSWDSKLTMGGRIFWGKLKCGTVAVGVGVCWWVGGGGGGQGQQENEVRYCMILQGKWLFKNFCSENHKKRWNARTGCIGNLLKAW